MNGQCFTIYKMFIKDCPFFLKYFIIMEKNKIKYVTVKKIYQILNCHHTKFYNDYAPVLKKHSIFDPNWKNRRLYPLDKVMELKDEIDAKNNFIIVD